MNKKSLIIICCSVFIFLLVIFGIGFFLESPKIKSSIPEQGEKEVNLETKTIAITTNISQDGIGKDEINIEPDITFNVSTANKGRTILINLEQSLSNITDYSVNIKTKNRLGTKNENILKFTTEFRKFIDLPSDLLNSELEETDACENSETPVPDCPS